MKNSVYLLMSEFLEQRAGWRQKNEAYVKADNEVGALIGKKVNKAQSFKS